jgi:anti-sigma B factor antagonist
VPPVIVPNTPVPVVALRGDVDLTASRELGAQLGELAGDPGVGAVLDLTEVSFLDSVALGVILKGAGRFRRQAKRLAIVAPEGPVRRLLELSGVDDRLALAASRDDAITLALGR